ncbi:poly(A)-specific ribonuclease [Saccharomycopsis crataegensis]|uniref:PAN2-PAN3 deadenylation complex catalytic subunit PAN2 n=1 Tax=Saccharomycopsis crataegensis TaxID=43959 RepID=A0AAV5QS55_9ASCO|nr:poly(A)-specific ribonuclease [Saccharomycopsis crataegensis]
MENFQQIHFRQTKHGDGQVSSVLFDDTTDLVWIGDSKGRATSYSGPSLTAYTSFVATNGGAPIVQFLNHPRGILALGKYSLKLSNRQSFPLWHVGPHSPSMRVLETSELRNFTAMCYGSASQSSVVIGGEIDAGLIDFDLNKLKVSSTISHEGKVAVMKSSNKYLVVGNANGSLDILDPSSNNSIVKNFQSHQLSFSKIDLQNYLLVTTGYSKRHNYASVAVVDPLINVYDLRYLKPLAPTSFPAGASFVSLHPKMQNMCFACSATGQLQFIDLFNINNFKIYQVNLLNPHGAGSTFLGAPNGPSSPKIVKMEISNSGDYLILVDNYNTVYLWSTDPTSGFNNYSKQLEYPVGLDYEQLKSNSFNVTDFDKKLNMVGMPYYKESLLSNYSSDLKFNAGTLPKKIPTELIRNSESTKRGTLAPGFQRERTTEIDLRYSKYNRNKYGPRNLHQQWYSLDSKDKKGNVPRFISEKDDSIESDSESDSEASNGKDGSEDEPNDKIFKDSKLAQIFDYKPSSQTPLKIPPAFSKLHILYSRFGIEDFDFKFYNRSKKKFSGLEIDIQNSYCNSLLILYRFVPEFYNWLTESLTHDCFIYDRDRSQDNLFSKAGMQMGKSLLAEVGYLFDMMANSGGKNCRTTNFQNVLCSIREASQLGLIDNGKKGYSSHQSIDEDREDEEDKLKNLIHSFNRFILQRLSFDERRLHYNGLIKHNNEHQRMINFDEMRSYELDRIAGINMETEIKSTSCTFSSRKLTTVYNLELKCMGSVDTKNPLISSVADSPKISKNYIYSSGSFKGKNMNKYNNIYADHNNSAFLYSQSILPYIDAAMNNHSFTPVKTWCSECQKYQAMNTIKTVRNLPHVLSLNLNLDDDREVIRKLSQTQVDETKNGKSPHHWIVNEFYAKLSNSSQRPILKLNAADFNGKGGRSSSGNSYNQDDVRASLNNMSIHDRESLSSSGSTTSCKSSSIKKQKYGNEIIKYELTGLVCEIGGSEENNSLENKHLVTFVKVKNQTNDSYQWYLFNDFLIIPIYDENEVFNLSYWWKKPLIVLYQSNKSPSEFNYKVAKSGLNQEILYRDYFAHGTREGKIIEYELLTKEEAPKPGSLVALDAEFVILESDKYEIRSDGTKVLVKPKRQSLARVSVVRGDAGPKKGVPFIDDYIVIEEQVEDYITSFSGIEKGDLDPFLSKKSLTYLEVAYRKLWLLLQIGVVFVGHGLTNDFRAINIQVPDTQVRDTLKLYSKKDVKRKLGLKFLMFAVLGKDVQTGNHDSIEDARSALELYDRYADLVSAGKFENELNRIYREGTILGFKVPGS